MSKVHKVHLMASLVTRITFSCNPCHDDDDDDDGDADYGDANTDSDTNDNRHLRAVRSSIS